MRINGKVVEGPNEVVRVIPRNNGELVFKAKAVLDYTIFEGICPPPEPPKKMKPGQDPEPDYSNAEYVKALDEYATKRFHYMVLKSLEATDGLEWDTVDINEPDTWDKYEGDLKNAGFTEREIVIILDMVMEANSLNDDKIQEATKRFLQSRPQENQ